MSNIFYRNFSEISGERLDSSYYIPELVELEQKITNISSKKLKDFVLSISSGATPKTTEQGKYYTEDQNLGIPFLRVQNLSREGNIRLNNIKYINKDTHYGMLKRSQIEESDLLIKITGVGRMAIASVPKIGFKGNTNQHMVVVKTRSRLVSQTLATYLNLDIAEKLASRRVTGGTRPALDYPALLSIPIIYDERIVQILEQAHQQKQQKEQEAKTKLESIDAYLLDALGIELPKDKNESLEDRVFFRKFSEVSGDRIDPKYNDYITKYKVILDKSVKLGSLLKRKPQYGANEIAIDYNEKCQYIRITDIDGFGELKKNGLKSAEVEEEKYQLDLNDILIARSGATVGKAYIHKDKKINAIFAGYMIRFKIDEKKINPKYVFYYMHSSIYKQWIEAIQRSAAQPNINAEEYQDLDIPILEKSMQDKIVKHITTLREEVETLKKEAAEFYDKAKLEVEKMILGEENVF